MSGLQVMSPFQCATARFKLARAVAAVKPSPTSAKIGGLIRTGYLTTLTGAEKHLVSVALHQGVEALITHPGRVTTDYLMALAQSVASHVKGEHLPPSAFRQTGFAWNSRAGRLMLDAFTKGSKEAWQAIRSGVDPQVVGDAFNVQRVHYENPLLQSAVDHVNTVVTARNKPFWDMALQGSLYVQAKALAIREGLTGAEQAARVDALLAKPTDEMAATALQAADKQTFSNVGILTKGVEGFRRALASERDKELTRGPTERAKIQAAQEGLTGADATERVHRLLSLSPSEFEQQVKVPRAVTGAPAAAQRARGAVAGAGLVGLDVTVPFARIGFNLAARGIDYSPLGAGKALATALIAKDPAIFREGLITAGAGTAVGLATGYYLASEGRMTGSADKAHPNSVKIGDTWHNYTVFLPFGMMPLFGANFYEQQRAHPESLVRNAVVASGEQAKALTQQSVLFAMQHVANMFGGTASALASGASGLVPIPPVVGQLAHGIDPYVRNTSAGDPVTQLLKMQAARLPGVSMWLPPKLDRFGQPLERPEGILGALLDPTQPESDQVPARAKRTVGGGR